VQRVDQVANDDASPGRIYTLCFFQPRAIVPEVVLIEAVDDAEALAEARSRRGYTTREIWDRHRLVGVLEPIA
jgi:hypothetical protein